MFCFHHDGDAVRLETIHERFRDLRRKIFLNLQTAREDIDNARHFREPDDFSVRNISDVRAADEREQMMFAQRVKLDVFDENDLARLGIEDSIVNDLLHALAVTLREKFQCARGPCRCPYQSLSRGIFADRIEQIAIDFR